MGLLDGIASTVDDATDAAGDAVQDAGEEAEEWYGSGTSRDIHDWAFDYDQQWQGSNDQHDIVGPSVDFGALFDAESEESAFQWNNDSGAEEDPTNPDNWPVPASTVKWAVGGLLLVVILGQLFDVQVGGGS